jgi:hypothetical protein
LSQVWSLGPQGDLIRTFGTNRISYALSMRSTNLLIA